MKKITVSLSRNMHFLYVIFCLLNGIQLARLETVRFEKIWHELSIKEQYEFKIPQVDVNCACRSSHDIVRETTRIYDTKNLHWSEQICVIYDLSSGAQCWIHIWPAEKENYYTAYKLDHSNKLTFLSISYLNGNHYEQINIPKGINKVKVSDNAILKFDTRHVSFDNLNAFKWFYGERNSNDIKGGYDINDVHERNLTKLGWYRLNLATGKYDVDEKTIKSNLIVNDRCPTRDVEWSINSNHYYNRNGLLRSSLPGISINDVTGRIVDNVIINSEKRTISIEYGTNSH